MMTTTLLSPSSNFAMGPLLGLGQPADVVETALEIAAVLERGALIAKERPHLRVGVERPRRGAAHRLEEVRTLGALHGFEPVAGAQPLERPRVGPAQPGDAGR